MSLFRRKLRDLTVPPVGKRRDKVVSFRIPMKVISMQGESVLSGQVQATPFQGQWAVFTNYTKDSIRPGVSETVIKYQFRARCVSDPDSNWVDFETWESELPETSIIFQKNLLGHYYLTDLIMEESHGEH